MYRPALETCTRTLKKPAHWHASSNELRRLTVTPSAPIAIAVRQAAKRVGHGNMKVVDTVEEWANLVEVASAAAGLQPVTAEVLLELCNLEKRVFSSENAAAWLTKLRQSTFADTLVQGMFLPPRYPMINANAMVRYLTKLTNRWKVLPVSVWAFCMSGCMHACPPAASTSDSAC